MEKYYIEFKRWLRDNGFDDNAKYYWWNIDTSFVKMLSYFKNIDNDKVLFVRSNSDNFSEKNNKILIQGFKRELSYAAIHQHIRVAIIFGVIKLNESFKIKTISEFIDKWSKGEITLTLNPNFLKANDYIDYLFENMTEIKELHREIELNYKDSFLYEDLYNVIFDLYLFFIIERDNLLDNPIIVDKLVNKFKKKINSKANSWKSPYTSNKGLNHFNQVLFAEKNELLNDRYLNAEENKAVAIGYIGEYLFNIFTKHKSMLINKINHPVVKKLPFRKIDWVSIKNKYSKYDFTIDDNFFEVKSTSRSNSKYSFIISYNELKHMEECHDYSYLCVLKNINPDKVTFNNEKEDLKLFNEIDMTFLDIKQLKRDFNLTNKGYWVIEK